MPDQLHKINPQIKGVEIGTRDLRKVKIYPLSLGDEIEFADIITEAIAIFVDKGIEDELTIPFVVNLIKENLSRIIGLITYNDKPDDLMKNITNLQAVEIAQMIWDVNFSEPSKNVQSLLEKIKTQYQSGRQQPQSVNDMDIDSTTFSENLMVKEESQKAS